MFKLIIRKGDGSHYWTEHFNKQNQLEKWLAEEMTRPYWKQEFTTEIIDQTPPPPSAEEIAEKEAEKVEQEQTRVFLKGLRKSDLTDVDKCASAIMKIIKHLRADK